MKSPDRAVPSLESLESRSLPASVAPTSLDDSVVAGASTLRNAILAANADTSADDFTISLRSGTYRLTQRNTAGQENAAARGDLDVTTTAHKVVIEGQGARGRQATVIDATALQDRIFHLLGPGVRLELRDLVLRGGVARDDGTAEVGAGETKGQGGAILNKGGAVTLVNVLVTGNRAFSGGYEESQGGGIYSEGGEVTLTANAAGESALVKNVAAGFNAYPGTDASGGQGGGLYVSNGRATLDAVSLTGNVARGGKGGRGEANGARFDTSIADGGAGGAGEGGGLYAAASEVTLRLTTFSGNQALGGSGGVGLSGNWTIKPSGESVFRGGGGAGGAGGPGIGGGLYASGGSLSVSNSTFGGNRAAGGDGAAGGTGVPRRRHDTSSSGTIGGYGGSGGAGGSGLGGGLYASGGAVTLLSSTFSGNAVGKAAAGGAAGGGLHPGTRGTAGVSQGGGLAGRVLTVRNTLIAGNAAGSGPDFSGSAEVTSGNLLGTGVGATGFIDGNGNQVGTTGGAIDPRLGKLGFYGGRTATFALLPGSPALNAGDDSAAAGATDQRGGARSVNRIDIGAVERQADLRLTPASPASAKLGGAITFTLTVTNLGPDAAASLALTSAVPAGATFVSLTVPRGWAKTVPQVGGTGAITATLPTLAKGGRATLKLVVRVSGIPIGGMIDLTATVGSSLDPAADNNTVNRSVPLVT